MNKEFVIDKTLLAVLKLFGIEGLYRQGWTKKVVVLHPQATDKSGGATAAMRGTTPLSNGMPRFGM